MQDLPDYAEMLQQVLDAFNRHDLEAIMTNFSDDAVFETPRGRDPWGTRSVGKESVRAGLAARFSSIPDVQYLDDRHVVIGNRGVSEWLLRGYATEGEQIEGRECDLWESGTEKSCARIFTGRS